MIDVTLAWRPPTWRATSPHMFTEATTFTTRAPFVGSAGAAPQPAITPASSSPETKPETVFITRIVAATALGRELPPGACARRGAGMPDVMADEQSTAELLRRLSEQTTELARKEIELAKLELQEKGRKAGIGAGLFGGAGALGFYALGAFTAFLILVLDTAMAAWLAALIVTVVYGAIAGVLALQGRTKVQEATPPVPEQAVETTKEDVEWVKTRAKAAR